MDETTTQNQTEPNVIGYTEHQLRRSRLAHAYQFAKPEAKRPGENESAQDGNGT
jgi:hypothetical protein